MENKTELEQAAINFTHNEINSCESYHDLHYGFTEGAKWQAEQLKNHVQKLNDLCGKLNELCGNK